MKLRFLLHRRRADALPLLPDGDSATTPAGSAREERLERLLTQSELDLVEHHLL
ncbi:hypothetical protein [Nocardia terpenica]|uniref:hypothetical protein n=1 Tax=Nocardia terpenica TaxID=455432 RepID=UPI0012FD1ECC|nr:hypothetical protein [Nocardia terpenica]